MSSEKYFEIEFLLRHAAAGYGIALLLFLALTMLTRSPRSLRTAVFRSFIVIGFIIAWAYLSFILGSFLAARPVSALFRILSAILTVPVHAWTRNVFVMCLLLPIVSLQWWRTKPHVSALLMILVVNTDWLMRVMQDRASIAAIGGRSPEAWYENRIYSHWFPTSLSLLYAAGILGICVAAGLVFHRIRFRKQ